MSSHLYESVDFLFFSTLFGDDIIGYSALVSVFSAIAIMIRLVVILPSYETTCAEFPGTRGRNMKRRRRRLSELRREYGKLFRCAYRMDWNAFSKLHCLLKPKLEGRENDTGRGRPNGPISADLKLSAALRYFGGGSSHDIFISHGISRSEFYECVWDVVDAVNQHFKGSPQYPTSHETQKKIAKGFSSKSAAGFTNCAGCIDGMLLWIEKPSEAECRKAGVDSGKFYCGRKGKYGLNLQAICDNRRRFLDVSLRHPASASDYISFATSNVYHKLKRTGFLATGLCIYGDNAYANLAIMVVPFLCTACGPRP